MYIEPQKYKCIKCGYEEDWSPHAKHSNAPVIGAGPVCPSCWKEFINANLGIMYCTVNWRDGSEYDKKMAKK